MYLLQVVSREDVQTGNGLKTHNKSIIIDHLNKINLKFLDYPQFRNDALFSPITCPCLDYGITLDGFIAHEAGSANPSQK